MKTNFLELAQERTPNIALLINMISARVKQLNHGQRPLSKRESIDMDNMNLAIKEIAEGKLTAESFLPGNEGKQDNLISL